MGWLGVVGWKLPFRLHNRYRGKANRHTLIIRNWPAMFSSSPWSLRGIKGVQCRSTCPFTAQYHCVYITIKPLGCARYNQHLRLHMLPAQCTLKNHHLLCHSLPTSKTFEDSCYKVNAMNFEAENYFPKFQSLKQPVSHTSASLITSSRNMCWGIDWVTGLSANKGTKLLTSWLTYFIND
jgi:hypothetical protein